jgi:hypothetical protein
VIARLVRRNLGVEPAFFGGSDIARRWRAFGEVVERVGASRRAAITCFEDLEAWVCRPHHPIRFDSRPSTVTHTVRPGKP